MASPSHENVGLFTRGYKKLEALPQKIWSKVVEIGNTAWKIGKEDPKRVIHSFKVGLGITLVSLFFYFEPLFKGFGVAAMWAVLTVVVVLEFSVGATLGKGLNRMLSTLIAGSLGVVAHRIASHTGETGEPILIAIFVFIVAAIVTFVRFFPRLKSRYDYGLMLFILTFSLISVSGYRDDEVLEMAHERVATIVIGSLTSVLVCLLICPVWIGQDLHNLIAANIDKLGNFLEGFGDEYFTTSEDRQSNTDKSFLQGFKSVLTSKNNEEAMANLARWEPCHGRFKFRHPWKQYLKVGTLTRQCAFNIEALHNYLNSEIQTPMEIRNKLKEACTKISTETGKALKELASSVKTMTRSSSAALHVANSKVAVEDLKLRLNSSLLEDSICLVDIIPVATVASLLIDIVTCTEKIAKSVEELASLANFTSCDPNNNRPAAPQQHHLLDQGTIQPDFHGSRHVINIDDEPFPTSPLTTENSSVPLVGR